MKKSERFKLSSTPIAEAVFCIDISGVSQCKKNELAALMGRMSPDYIPDGDSLTNSFTFDMAHPERGASPTTVYSGSRFKRGQSEILGLMNLDGQTVRLAYSRLPPYDGWDRFANEGKRLLDGYIRAAASDSGPVIKRVGIRFINKIALPPGGCEMKEVFCSAPNNPDEIRSIRAENFLYRDTAYYNDYDLYGTVVKTLVKGSDGRPVAVFDADVFCMPAVAYQNFGFEKLLAAAHALKNDLFFGSLTASILEKYR